MNPGKERRGEPTRRRTHPEAFWMELHPRVRVWVGTVNDRTSFYSGDTGRKVTTGRGLRTIPNSQSTRLVRDGPCTISECLQQFYQRYPFVPSTGPYRGSRTPTSVPRTSVGAYYLRRQGQGPFGAFSSGGSERGSCLVGLSSSELNEFLKKVAVPTSPTDPTARRGSTLSEFTASLTPSSSRRDPGTRSTSISKGGPQERRDEPRRPP